jgi:hypothetical protein
MPGTPNWDLAKFSEKARRRLHDRIAAEVAPPGGRYTADDAGLQITFLAGRWFAVWIDLEEPAGQPVALRIRIVRIGLGADGEVELYDV